MGNYTTPWKKYATFSGRASLGEYWTFVLINVAIFLVLFIAALVVVVNSAPGQASPLLLLPSGVFVLATVIPHVAALVRRLHDAGQSGVWALLVVVPLASLVVLALSLLSGTVGPNEYGQDPRAPKLAPEQPPVPQPLDAPGPPAAPLFADPSAPAPLSYTPVPGYYTPGPVPIPPPLYYPPVPGYYPPGPAPIPPPRKSRTLPIVLGVVGGLLAVLVLFTFVQSAVDAYRQRASAARSASATPAATHSPSTPPTPTFTPYNGDLADLLLPLPSGATPYSVPFLTAGMTDTQRVSMIWNSNQPTWMSDALTEWNFWRSADREWTLPGDGVFLILLQFSQPVDATNWYEDVSTIGFSGPELESAGGSISSSILTSRYATLKLSNGHRLQIGLAVYGQFAIFVEVATGSPQTDFPTLQSVAVSQYQRLPAS
jgi:uncharacterized membrane protein YhaH (DUF805 family)